MSPVYHLSSLYDDLDSWPREYEGFKQLVKGALTTFRELEAEHLSIKQLSFRDIARSERLGALREVVMDAGPSLHALLMNKLKEMLTDASLVQKEEILNLPGIFNLFSITPTLSSTTRETLELVLHETFGSELFIEAHRPDLDSSGAISKASALNAYESLVYWPELLDSSTAVRLWSYAKDEIRRLEELESTPVLETILSDGFLIWTPRVMAKDLINKTELAEHMLVVRFLPQSVIDELSFLNPYRGKREKGSRADFKARRSPNFLLESSARPRPWLHFSRKAQAWHFRASYPSRFEMLVKDMRIDPEVVGVLAPSWQGSADSLLEAARSLSADA